MSEALARSQINLKTERKPAGISPLSLQIDEQQYFSHKQKRSRASSLPLFKLMNKMFAGSSNLFEAEVCGKFICIWRQCCAGCRSALHTQETANTHKAFRIAASPTLEGKGGGRALSQSHSRSSLLRNDWPNKPLTGFVLPGAGDGLSIWSCCLVVAE